MSNKTPKWLKRCSRGARDAITDAEMQAAAIAASGGDPVTASLLLSAWGCIGQDTMESLEEIASETKEWFERKLKQSWRWANDLFSDDESKTRLPSSEESALILLKSLQNNSPTLSNDKRVEYPMASKRNILNNQFLAEMWGVEAANIGPSIYDAVIFPLWQRTDRWGRFTEIRWGLVFEAVGRWIKSRLTIREIPTFPLFNQSKFEHDPDMDRQIREQTKPINPTDKETTVPQKVGYYLNRIKDGAIKISPYVVGGGAGLFGIKFGFDMFKRATKNSEAKP